MNLLNLSLTQAIEKLNSKEIKSEELVNSYVESSKISDKELNLYVTSDFERAIEKAKKSDERRAQNKQFSDIDGIPIGVKDLFLTKGLRTTAASKMLENFIAPYESTVTQNLENAGYINLGKLNMDEFAMGSTNTTSYFGPSLSPWWVNEEEKKVPGGSSGGSAAAVAARACLASLGSDTGGSIRQPAAFCSLVGIKPTYGTCSRYGMIAFASSLDQAGPMTRTVLDNAIMLNYMAGYDKKDSSMIPYNKIDYASLIGSGIQGKVIGIPKEFLDLEMKDYIKESWEEGIKILEEAGAVVKEISIPHINHSLAVYYTIAPVEANSNLARFDGVRYGSRAQSNNLEELYKNTRNQGFGEEVRARIVAGAYNLKQDTIGKYFHAAKVRKVITKEILHSFDEVDCILSPTTPTVAFGLNDKMSAKEVWSADLYTVAVNLAGIPAINVPAGFNNEGLPIGIQLIGKYFAEPELYQIAHVLEKNFKADKLSNFVLKHNLF